jgi:hypothetical protein
MWRNQMGEDIQNNVGRERVDTDTKGTCRRRDKKEEGFVI